MLEHGVRVATLDVVSVPVSEPNKGLVSRAVEAIKEVAAPLMLNKEADKPTEL